MELCYIWIYNGFFYEQGFNFCKDFEFNIVNKNNTEYLLYMKEKRHLPHDFYGDVIQNITAIVGRNGSGKSSFIKFFRECLGEGPTVSNGTGYISVIKINNKFFISCNFDGYYKKLCYDNSFVEICKKYNLDYTGRENLPIRINEYAAEKFTNFIFFSNTFDFGVESINGSSDKMINLTMNDLVKNVSKNNKGNKDLLISIRENEFKESLEFLCDRDMVILLKEKVNDIPNVLRIKLIKDYHFGIEKAYKEEIDKILEMVKIDNIDDKKYSQNKFEEMLCKLLVYDICVVSSFDIKYVGDLSRFSNYIDVIKFIIDEVQVQNYDAYKTILESYEGLTQKCKFIAVGQNIFDNYYIEILVEEISELKDEIVKLHESIGIIASKNDFISLRWSEKQGGISTGQYSKFRFYYNIYNYCIKRRDINKNVILFLDEIETYMHPEWQRSCIKDIVEFINIIFNKEDTVQIILTTNGPFILSDIPVQNINFLENIKGHSEVNVGSNARFEETFGQNIHTLLKKSFFMEEGTIGEFAKGKIQETMNLLNSANENEIIQKKDYILNLIETIGEPITRKILSRKFYSIIEKQLDEVKKIDDEIKKLEEKRKKLLLGDLND